MIDATYLFISVNEELVPVFLYVLVKANIPNAASRLELLADFVPNNNMDTDALYAITMLKAALQWTLTFTVDEDAKELPPAPLVQEHNLLDFDDETFEMFTGKSNMENSSDSVLLDDTEVLSSETILMPTKQDARFTILQDFTPKENSSTNLSQKLLQPVLLPRKESMLMDNTSLSVTPFNQISNDFVITPKRSAPTTSLHSLAMRIVEKVTSEHDQFKIQGRIEMRAMSKYHGSDEISHKKSHTFLVHLTNTKNITDFIPADFATIAWSNDEGILLQCQIESKALEDVVMIGSYIVNEQITKSMEQPLDITIKAESHGTNVIDLIAQVQPTANDTLVEKLSLLLQPVIRGRHTKRVTAYPLSENSLIKFREATQQLEWTASQSGIAHADSHRFRVQCIVEGDGQYERGAGKAKFIIDGRIYSGITVENCMGKKSEHSNDVFVGGARTSTIYEIDF
jgi:hypothetical protein